MMEESVGVPFIETAEYEAFMAWIERTIPASLVVTDEVKEALFKQLHPDMFEQSEILLAIEERQQWFVGLEHSIMTAYDWVTRVLSLYDVTVQRATPGGDSTVSFRSGWTRWRRDQRWWR